MPNHASDELSLKFVRSIIWIWAKARSSYNAILILYILAILLWISFSFRWGQQEDARPGSQGWLQTPIAEVANHYSFRSDDALGPHHQPLATIYLSDAIGKTRLKLAK